jgi:hypothetical protein
MERNTRISALLCAVLFCLSISPVVGQSKKTERQKSNERKKSFNDSEGALSLMLDNNDVTNNEIDREVMKK